MPKSVVFPYLTDVYCNEFAISLFAGRIVEPAYIVLSLGAFLGAAHYVSICRSVHDEIMSVCAGRGALLQVAWELIGQRLCYRIFGILKNTDVHVELALFAIARAANVDWDARPEVDWFPYTFVEEMISVLSASALLRQFRATGVRIENVACPWGASSIGGILQVSGCRSCTHERCGSGSWRLVQI